MGFEQPSPIQAKTIPLALAGKDIIGLSQTGSGKTAAFALPTLQQIDATLMKPQALIVCPTRELAVQVCEEVFKLGSALGNIRSMPVYGGAPIDRQLRALRKGTHIVVGTPGRLLDHLRRKSFDPSHIKTVILDEADRMLDMGFREEMEDMLKVLPKNRQTLFFSATMPAEIESLAKFSVSDPEKIEIGMRTSPADTVTHAFYPVAMDQKYELLSGLLAGTKFDCILVFCRTKDGADRIARQLKKENHSVIALHSNRTQREREEALEGFKSGRYEVLVATDIAARGLDIAGVSHVINYDIPSHPEDYVHRIGRTGRAQAVGDAFTLVTAEDLAMIESIERFIGAKIARLKLENFDYKYTTLLDPRAAHIKARAAGGGRHRSGYSFGIKRRR